MPVRDGVNARWTGKSRSPDDRNRTIASRNRTRGRERYNQRLSLCVSPRLSLPAGAGAGSAARSRNSSAKWAANRFSSEAFAPSRRIPRSTRSSSRCRSELTDASARISAALPVRIVAGGARRQDSVANAFQRSRSRRADVIVIHDAARPFASADLISRTIAAAVESGAALAALQARDTVKRSRAPTTRRRRELPARAPSSRPLPRRCRASTIFLAQTPQAFRRAVLRRRAALTSADRCDRRGGACRARRSPVRIVDGEATNIKITTPDDLAVAEAIARGASVAADRAARTGRAGTGYDLHRLVEGRPLILGGVTIPFERGALGHSDADVVCHAVTDAVLGAAGLGDIGRHFPDSDPQWKDASSIDLLRARGGARAATAASRSATSTSTVIPERPKIAPYVDAMRAALAAALGIDGRTRQHQRQDQRGRRRDRPRRSDRRARDRAADGHEVGELGAAYVTDDASSFRTQPHRTAARRQRAHGALQLAAGARPAAARSSCASRTPTSSARRANPKPAILDDLRWLGLDWDEGPDVGGPHGPYRQSERLHLYRVVREGAARAAARPITASARPRSSRPSGRRRSPQDARRATPARAAGCRTEQARRADRGRRAPGDPLPRARGSRRRLQRRRPRRGPLPHRRHRRSGHRPRRRHAAYNFAVVVDDALMEVTHVIRGEDHISNTPRQILLYEALGFTPPTFAHLALVMGPDHTPLSKRHGATSVGGVPREGLSARSAGELSGADRLVAAAEADDELLPIDELARRFSLEDVGHSAGVFDEEKLAWVNRHYLKMADPVRLAELSVPYFAQAGVADAPRPPRASSFWRRRCRWRRASVDRLESGAGAARVPVRLRRGGGAGRSADVRDEMRRRRRARGRARAGRRAGRRRRGSTANGFAPSRTR